MKVVNITRNAILADEAKMADSFLARLVGLLNRKSLNKGEALILAPSNSIHSFFMRFAIDVIFLDKTGKVIAVIPSFKPFRLSRIHPNSSTVIELPESTLQLTHTEAGDLIQII